MYKIISIIVILLYCTGCNSDSTSAPKEIDVITDENTTTPLSDVNETIIVIPPSKEQTGTCEPKYSTNILEGRDLYNQYCQVCHASDAKSGNFDIRGSVKEDIDAAMALVPNMRSLDLASQVSDEQREQIALFLQMIWIDPDVEFGNECSDVQTITKEALGNKLFFDSALSLQKTMSCSTCHNPGHGFIDARFYESTHDNPTQGALSVGDDGVSLGGRNTPSITYAMFSPTFSKNSQGVYVGGQFHDGRASTLQEQAKGPFLDPAEMMMPNAQALIDRVLENQTYVTAFQFLYGDDIFNDVTNAFNAVADSVAQFEKTYIFAPFDSKYDRSKLEEQNPDYYKMTDLENAGYKLFFDTNKTKCVLCHSINSKDESPYELFSNFQYENIGTPKNITALQIKYGNTETTDLQLGGRPDINESNHYGKTKVPILRNVAITQPYMSNGIFKSLRTVLAFHNYIGGNNTITLNPETMLPWGEAEVSTTINDKKLQMQPFTNEDLDALEAFLKTLTDKQYEGLIK